MGASTSFCSMSRWRVISSTCCTEGRNTSCKHVRKPLQRTTLPGSARACDWKSAFALASSVVLKSSSSLSSDVPTLVPQMPLLHRRQPYASAHFRLMSRTV